MLNTCKGFSDEGITRPTKESQVEMLQDFYKQCDVLPSAVDIIEAHGTGNVSLNNSVLSKCSFLIYLYGRKTYSNEGCDTYYQTTQ